MNSVDDSIRKILARFPDTFTDEEKEVLLSDDCPVRQCDICGDFMADGWYFELFEHEYYCSEECLRKDGISHRDQILYYYGFDPEEVKEEIEGMTDEEAEKWAEENGSEDDSIGFWTDWAGSYDSTGIGYELVDKLNELRMQM